MKTSELIRVYHCLCDETRLRMLNLLTAGPLCVCDFQEILSISQVKASRHLAHLREEGMVEVAKQANRRVYSLPAAHPSGLERHLACLQDCAGEIPQLQNDLNKRRKLDKEIAAASPDGCP